MEKIAVGIIGLGEVAQIIHLPILAALSEHFEIAALCDLSEQLLTSIGQRYHVERLYTDYRQLVALPAIKAVFVLNSDEYHADCTIAAARNGKHVLVEKPMCLNDVEAEAIIQARASTNVQIMVGYMRRFAPAFIEGVQQVRQLEKINYVRVHDIIGANRLIIEQANNVIYPQDLPAYAMQERKERAHALLHVALGDVSPQLMSAYRMLCGLGSHDLSAMREIIGKPKRVLAATQWNAGRFMNATFAYDGYCASFEMGVDSQRHFDAHIEIYGEKKRIRIQYDSPYIRHLPTTLHMQETHGDAYREWMERPTYTDPYTHELLYFYNVVMQGCEPKTSPEDFRFDLALFAEIIQRMVM